MTTLCSTGSRQLKLRRWMASAAILVSFAAVGLGGCESGTSILGSAASPTPQAALAQPQTGSTTVQTAKIQIAPVIGSPETVSRDLQTQLASSIGRYGVKVATASNAPSEYVVRGYIVAAREKSNAKISYIWDVTDQSGKRVHRITGEEVAKGAGKDPWAAITPQIVQSISDKTATQIASWLPGGAGVPVASNTTAAGVSGASKASASAGDAAIAPTNAAYTTAANTPAAAQPTASTTGSIATSGPITAVVPTVTGAPGDGGASLTTAIQRELTKSGVALANVPDARSYKVEGKVAMGESKDGKQPIQIDWNVLDPSGKKLGTVSQKNEVPQGSLNGSWGKTADAAAAAAAQGIIKLLPSKSTN